MRLGIVVPCYNEEEVLHESYARLSALLRELVSSNRVAKDSAIYFVDDGSRDSTWSIIEGLSRQDRAVVGIKLSRNRGHQNALIAGLLTAQGDALVSIDADLQDDVQAIALMVDEHAKGHEIVYGVRSKREQDTIFKRATAEGFYRMMRLMGADTVFNHADFRLLSRRAIDSLRQFGEVNLFLRGIVTLIGFRSTVVYYERAPRFAGESKYPLKRMIEFALDAITSFSIVPLRMITMIGTGVFLLTVALSAWILWTRLTTDNAVPGWASTTLPLLFIGGVQILCLGVMGEYLGKIYTESKGRPRYFIEKVTDGAESQN